jgi:heme/copper-type cytochrome/quinol oxidase subunit 3
MLQMLLFLFSALLMFAILFGAGYSHYRYRVRNNEIYRAQLARKNIEMAQRTSKANIGMPKP